MNTCVRFTYKNLPRTAHVTPYSILVCLGGLSERLHLLVESIMRRSAQVARTIFYCTTARTSDFDRFLQVRASQLINSLPAPVPAFITENFYECSLFSHLQLIDLDAWKAGIPGLTLNGCKRLSHCRLSVPLHHNALGVLPWLHIRS